MDIPPPSRSSWTLRMETSKVSPLSLIINQGEDKSSHLGSRARAPSRIRDSMIRTKETTAINHKIILQSALKCSMATSAASPLVTTRTWLRSSERRMDEWCKIRWEGSVGQGLGTSKCLEFKMDLITVTPTNHLSPLEISLASSLRQLEQIRATPFLTKIGNSLPASPKR